MFNLKWNILFFSRAFLDVQLICYSQPKQPSTASSTLPPSKNAAIVRISSISGQTPTILDNILSVYNPSIDEEKHYLHSMSIKSILKNGVSVLLATTPM